jgi:hypothetical protein
LSSFLIFVLYISKGTIIERKALEITPQVFDTRIGDNAKKDEASQLSKKTASDLRETANRRIKTKVKQNQDEELTRRQTMKEKGLYLCDAQDSVTKRFFRKIYLTSKGLEDHEAGRGSHNFLVGVTTTTKLLLPLSKPGGFPAAGSRPDWMSKGSLVDVIEFPEECEYAKCFGAFNGKEDGIGKKFTTNQQPT